MVDYDFIEIGTSISDTLIEKASDTTIGLSIEPIKKYIDMLPNKKNVTKINTAITTNRTTDSVDVYYIPDDVIDAKGFPEWLKGCNSINKYHPNHWNKLCINEVKIEKAPLLNIDELFEQYNVKTVKLLKIDTEGHDCIILKGLFSYLKTQNREKYPHKIEFESNMWTPKTDVDNIINIAIDLGYKVVSRGHDTILMLDTDRYNIKTVKRINGRFKLI